MRHRRPIVKKPSKIVESRRGYAAISKEGIEFVRKRYCCSVELDSEEIKLYGFLMRLLSFGGKLPLALIKKWGYGEVMRKAVKNRYLSVTASRQRLPTKQIEDAIKEIWGEIPKGIYV